MCLGIPMKIVSLDGNSGIVEAGGLKRKADFSLMRNVKTGDYILMHAGFAIEKVKASEARKTLEVLKHL